MPILRYSILLSILVLALGCQDDPPEALSPEAQAELDIWLANREASMQSETSWLNLAGLFWLDEGQSYTFGSDPENDLVFPKGPEQMGTMTRNDSLVSVEIASGVEITANGEPVSEVDLLAIPGETPPTVLELGSLRWFAIARDGQVGIRLRDLEHPDLMAYEGIDRFPNSAAWRVEATLEPHEEETTIAIPTVLGTVRQEASPGTLVFEVEGETYRLDPVDRPESERLFLIFADGTTGTETYGGGRFLYADYPDENGITTVDFNKAYNPPCAFSAYSTCPQPPPQNKLGVPITAGEKVYRKP